MKGIALVPGGSSVAVIKFARTGSLACDTVRVCVENDSASLQDEDNGG